MSQENVEIVKAAIDAANREDWDALVRAAAPSFELDMSLNRQRAEHRQHEVIAE